MLGYVVFYAFSMTVIAATTFIFTCILAHDSAIQEQTRAVQNAITQEQKKFNILLNHHRILEDMVNRYLNKKQEEEEEEEEELPSLVMTPDHFEVMVEKKVREKGIKIPISAKTIVTTGKTEMEIEKEVEIVLNGLERKAETAHITFVDLTKDEKNL